MMNQIKLVQNNLLNIWVFMVCLINQITSNHFKLQKLFSVFKSSYQFILLRAVFCNSIFYLVLSWILCVKYDQETSCQILCFKLLAFVLHHPKYSHISRYFLVFPKIETFQSFIETLYWNQVGKYLFESKNKDIRTTPT